MGKWIIGFFGAAAAALIVAAIATVGGPQAARDAKLDKLRVVGLIAAASSIICERGSQGEQNYDLSSHNGRIKIRCYVGTLSEDPMSDPQTGNPYQVIQSENELKACAEFNDPLAVAIWWKGRPPSKNDTGGMLPEWQDYDVAFDQDSGCLVFTK